MPKRIRRTQPAIRPFLKWPGGKYRQIELLKKHLPKGGLLIEPFVGAGSVFLNTDYPQYLLNDINPDLIQLFCLLQEDGPAVIREARTLFTPQNNTKAQYYAFREQFNQSQDPTERAILFIYLNRHGYNGLCRYNEKLGLYNVPFGLYKNPYFPEKEMLTFQQNAQNVTFVSETFQDTFKRITKLAKKQPCVVYCDPPYAPLSETARFTQYAPKPFPLSQQEALAQAAEKATLKGVTVLISNHDTPFTRKIYKNAKISSFAASRTISRNAQERKPVQELLAQYEPS